MAVRIDHTIYSQMRAPDIIGGFVRGHQAGSEMRDANEKRRLQQELQAGLKEGVVTNPDGTKSYDPERGYNALLGKGFVREANELKTNQLAQQQTQQKMQLDKQMREIDLVSRVAGSINDQASYEQGLNFLSQQGVDVSQMPRAYDPNLVNRYHVLSMTAKEQLENQLKQQQFGLTKEKTQADIQKTRAETRQIKSKTGAQGTDRFGKAPAGYRFKPDGSLEPIPGGPAAGKEEKRIAAEKQGAGLVVQDIGRSLNLIKENSTAAGPIVGQSARIPGTPAWQLQKQLESVKANIAFDKLQAMRAASPTGGALGNVSDRETAMLAATAGTLDPTLPQEVLEDNLKRLYNQYNDIIHGPGNGPERFQLSFDEQGNPVRNTPEIGSIDDGFRFKGGDPSRPENWEKL